MSPTVSEREASKDFVKMQEDFQKQAFALARKPAREGA
jgi:hypothetical protein